MITKEQRLAIGSKGYDLVFEWKGNIHAFKSESLSSWSKEKWCKFREETGLTAMCDVTGRWVFYDPEQYDVGCNLQYIGNNEKPDQPINCDDYAYMFTKYRGASLDLSHWDVSEAISFFSMFFNCKNLKSLNVNNWNVNQVTDLSYMFSECSQLRSLNLSNWDVSNVVDFGFMFANCWHLQYLELDDWNVSKGKDFRCMFDTCQQLKGLDINEWNVSKGREFSSMFCDCNSLENLDLSKWKISSKADTGGMFVGSSLEQCHDRQPQILTKSLENKEFITSLQQSNAFQEE